MFPRRNRLDHFHERGADDIAPLFACHLLKHVTFIREGANAISIFGEELDSHDYTLLAVVLGIDTKGWPVTGCA